MPDFIAYSLRVIIIYCFTYFGARILSKKAIAEMTAYEMAGIILISTIAAQPLVTKVVTKTVFSIGLLIILISFVSRLSYQQKLTPILEHLPTIIIKKGKIDHKALKSSNLSLNQLLGLLRQQGYFNTSDVEFALLEPQGKLSVLPKTPQRPVKISDFNIQAPYQGLTLPIIMNGTVIKSNLYHANLNTEWLNKELKMRDVKIPEIILAELDTSYNLNIIEK